MYHSNIIENHNLLLQHIHVFSSTISCKIFPNLGGSLQEFRLNNCEIIDGISISEEGLAEYHKAFQSALLFPFTGRIANGKFKFQGKTYQLQINELERSNALHGLIYNKTFKVESIKTSQSDAKIQLSYISQGNLKGFPFKFKIKAEYCISESGLRIEFDVTNTDTKAFPFGLGWHPYFNSTNLHTSELSFSANQKLECNENLIPIALIKHDLPVTFNINNDQFDNTFLLLNNQLNIKTEEYQMLMECNSKFLQLYTPEHRESIAIEPMTIAPNAFNSQSDVSILAPNENYTWTIDLKIDINV